MSSRPVTSGKPAPGDQLSVTRAEVFNLLPPWKQDHLTDSRITEMEKKPPGAKEYLKKDQEIILSPQRGSFFTDYVVSMDAASEQKRSNSSLNVSARQEFKRELFQETRRTGNGRLISRNAWDSGYRRPENEIDYSVFHGPTRETSSNSLEANKKDFALDREENYCFRSYDCFNSVNNFVRRRNDSFQTQKEPEWMRGGPTSRYDTIELQRFEDKPKIKSDILVDHTKTTSISDSTYTKLAAIMKESNESKMKNLKEDKDEEKEILSDEQEDQIEQNSDSITGNEIIQAHGVEHKMNDSTFYDFNIDDFLEPNYLSDMHIEVENGGNAVGSRFSQWFTGDRQSSLALSASTEVLNSGTNEDATVNLEDPRRISSMATGTLKNSSQYEEKSITNAFDSISLSENSKLPPAMMDFTNKTMASQLTDPKPCTLDLVQSLGKIESKSNTSSDVQNWYLPLFHDNVQSQEEMKLIKTQSMKNFLNDYDDTSKEDGHLTNKSQNCSIMEMLPMLNNAQGSQNFTANQEQNPCVGLSNNVSSQQPDVQVHNDLIMKILKACQVQNQDENMVSKAVDVQQQQQLQQRFKKHAYEPPVNLENNFYTMTKDLQSREAQEMLTDSQRTDNPQYLTNLRQVALNHSQMLKRQLVDQTYKKMENIHSALHGGEGLLEPGGSFQLQQRIGFTPTSVLRKMSSELTNHHLGVTPLLEEIAAAQNALQLQTNKYHQQVLQQLSTLSQQLQQQQQQLVNLTNQQILNGNCNYGNYQQRRQVTVNGHSFRRSNQQIMINQLQLPVSNQLAQWFTPELLARAREGNLPNMPAMPASLYSVEELEYFYYLYNRP